MFFSPQPPRPASSSSRSPQRSYTQHSVVSDKQSTLDGLSQKVAAAQAKAASAQAARANAQARRAAVTAVTSQRVTWEQVLRDLWARPAWERLAREPPGAVADSDGRGLDNVHDLDGDGRLDSDRLRRHRLHQLAEVRRARHRPALRSALALRRVAPAEHTRRHGEGGQTVQFTIGANLSSIGGK